MKKFLAATLHLLMMVILAGMLFVGSFFYEGNVISSVAQDKGTQIMLGNNFEGGVDVNRAGKDLRLAKGQQLEVNDIIESGQNNAVVINFSRDGELRLGQDTKLQIVSIDEERPAFIFKLLEGKIWLNNLYSNADLNILVDSGVIIPGQSVNYVSSDSGQTLVYAHQQAAVVGFVEKNYTGKKYVDENDSVLISKIYLPQGTQLTVFSDKINENKDTIAKLLFSKLVKEFNYSNFDKTVLISDEWLSKNAELDSSLTNRIRDSRLKKIRTRGLKYSSLEAANYKIDSTLRDLANTMTFSQERVGDRNLDALYDLLYDAQYLFDYGRKDEATERLNTFTSLAGELFVVYGDELKTQYQQRVKNEYEYLSFANPSDALFGLKLVLEKIYLDSLKGGSAELPTKFAFLTEKINTIGYYADNNDLKNLKDTFDDYMAAFKSLTDQYKSELTANITFVQRQNQALDNLFIQHPQLYRQAYFTGKLYVENKYLSLLPPTTDKIEEIQAVISQRIDFLRRLENFFLDGNVPLIDAQNILALLFTEISRIELPTQSQVAVSQLFRERLEDYGIFNRFLNSPEYVNSTGRGTTYKQRFEQFKKDNQDAISIDQLRSELSTQLTAGQNSATGTAPIATDVEISPVPGIDEESVIKNVDGNVIESNNGVDSSINKPKVPRVKNPN